jgi:hypothetical protein
VHNIKRTLKRILRPLLLLLLRLLLRHMFPSNPRAAIQRALLLKSHRPDLRSSATKCAITTAESKVVVVKGTASKDRIRKGAMMLG